MRYASFAALVFCALLLAGCADQVPPGYDAAERVAEEFVRSSSTYAYDGQDLELVDHVVLESFPEQHRVTYRYTSTHAGYGDRSGQVVAQVLTDHEVVVTVVEGSVVRAVVDGRWDALEQRMVEEEVSLVYAPRQCEDDPWDEWYAQGGAQFVAEPSEEELVVAYYGEERGVSVAMVSRAEREGAVCMACGCPETYVLRASVPAGAADVLGADGWVAASADASVSS